MGFFQPVEGEAAVLVNKNGIYRQVDVYTMNGILYAKISGGFIKLMADGSTTNHSMRLLNISWEGGLYRDRLGRLCTKAVKGATKLDTQAQQKLLGAREAA